MSTSGECGKVFTSKRNRKVHMRTHTRSYPFKSSECANAFNTRRSLDLHMHTHSGNYPFTCDYPNCNYTCTTEVNLNSHKCSKHTGERPFACDQPNCTHKYTTKSMLTNHKLTKHANSQFCGCSKCEKHDVQTIKHTPNCELKCGQPRRNYRFHSRTQLENDRRSKHTTDQLYFCNDCGKWLVSPCTLKHDIRKHFGNYPYSCEICDQKFLSKTKFTHHQQRHAEDRPDKNIIGKIKNAADPPIECQNARKYKKYPHYCQVCNKKFKSKRGMSGHSQIHRRVQPIKCIICHKNCVSQADLKSHTLLHHDDVPENCTYQRKILSVAKPAKNIPEQAIDPVIDEASQVCFKPFDDSARCRTFDKHVGSKSPHKLKQCTSALSYIDVPTQLRAANDITSMGQVCFKPFVVSARCKTIDKHVGSESPHKLKQCASTVSCIDVPTKLYDANDTASLGQVSFKPFDDSKTLDKHVVSQSPHKLKQSTSTLSFIQLHDAIDTTSLVNQMVPENCQPVTEPIGFANIQSDTTSENLLPPITENNAALIKQTKLTDQQNNNCSLQTNDFEKFKLPVTHLNLLPDSEKSTTHLAKQTDDQTVLSVADLIYLHDMNLQSLPLCNSREISTGIVTLMQRQIPQLHNIDSQVSAILSDAESGTNLGEVIDQQNSQSLSEPTDLQNLNRLVTLANPQPVIKTCKTSLPKQIKDQTNLSVAELIRLYDMNLKAQITSPSPRKENSQKIEKEKNGLQQTSQFETDVTDLGNTCVFTSQTHYQFSNAESSTILKECSDQQKLYSKVEETDLNEINLEASRRNPAYTNTGSNASFERQIHDQDLHSVVEVTDSDSDFQASRLLDGTKKRISCLEEQFRDKNVQSVVEEIDFGNDELPTSPRHAKPSCAEHLLYDNVQPAIHSNEYSLNTHNRNPVTNNAETRSNLIKQVDESILESIIPSSDFSKVSLRLSQTNLLKSSSPVTPVHYQSTDFALKQMNVSNTSLQLLPELATAESGNSMVKNSYLRKMRTRKDIDYFNILQTSEVEPKTIVNIKQNVKSATQINKTPQVEKKKVYHTTDMKTRAAKHIFMPDSDARLIQKASLKTAQIILERVDAITLLCQTTTKNTRDDADTSDKLTEPFSNQQKPNSPKIRTKSVITQPSASGKLPFRHKKGAMRSKKKTTFCGECGRSFFNQRSLYVHNFIHTGKYPFGCDQPNCSFKCHARLILENHKRSKHTGERPYICNECGKSFTSIKGLKDHSLRHKKAVK